MDCAIHIHPTRTCTIGTTGPHTETHREKKRPRERRPPRQENGDHHRQAATTSARSPSRRRAHFPHLEQSPALSPIFRMANSPPHPGKASARPAQSLALPPGQLRIEQRPTITAPSSPVGITPAPLRPSPSITAPMISHGQSVDSPYAKPTIRPAQSSAWPPARRA